VAVPLSRHTLLQKKKITSWGTGGVVPTLKQALFKQNRLFVGLILGGHQWDDKTRMTVDTSDSEACIGGVA
jgi:hypothetical protein